MLYPSLGILSHLPNPCTVARLLILWLIPSLPLPASLPWVHSKVPTSAFMAEPGQDLTQYQIREGEAEVQRGKRGLGGSS